MVFICILMFYELGFLTLETLSKIVKQKMQETVINSDKKYLWI